MTKQPKPLARPIVVGIDPSLTGTGVAVLTDGHLDHVDVIHTLPDTPRPVRLMTIREHVLSTLRTYRPEIVAIESEIFGMFHQAIEQGHLQGVLQVGIWAWMKHEGAATRFLSVNVAHVKKYLGAKHKENVLLQTFKQYGEEFTDHNAADAFMVGKVASDLLLPDAEGILTKPKLEVLAKLRATGFVWEPATIMAPKKKRRVKKP